MGTYIAPEDLHAAIPDVDDARLGELIADAEAFAVAQAPGLKASAFLANEEKMRVVKAVLRAAITYDAQVAAPFTETNEDPAPKSPTLLSPSQVALLIRISSTGVAVSGAYSMRLDVPDTLPRY